MCGGVNGRALQAHSPRGINVYRYRDAVFTWTPSVGLGGGGVRLLDGLWCWHLVQTGITISEVVVTVMRHGGRCHSLHEWWR